MISETKTLQSMTIFAKWLDALSIDNEINDDGTMTIQDVDSNPIDVCFSMDPIAENRDDGMIILDSRAFAGKDTARSKQLFKDFIESIGFTYKDPTGREGASRRVSAKEDFESVYLRHNDLRRSSNPDNDRLMFYAKTVDSVAKMVFNNSSKFFIANQVDLDDLKSIAMTHVVSYISNYEIPAYADTDNNNLKKCHRFLAQRLYLYKTMIMSRSSLQTIASSEDLVDSQTNYIYGNHNEPIDKDYVKRHNVFSSKDKAKRRQEAKGLLRASLEALTHDDMIATLTLASESYYIHVDAQKLATKMLKEHYVACSECLSQKGEQVSPMETGSV